eukprot:gene12585-26502_t
MWTWTSTTNITSACASEDSSSHVHTLPLRLPLPETETENAPTPLSWMKVHVGVFSLSASYDFSNTKVDLVAVVPGRDALPITASDVRALYARSDSEVGINEPLGAPCTDCRNCREKLHSSNNSNHSIPTDNNNNNNNSNNNNVDILNDGKLAKQSCSKSGGKPSSTPSRSPPPSLPSSPSSSAYAATGQKYGLSRLRGLLLKHYPHLSRPLTSEDILVVQPTSISTGIRNAYVAWMLHCMMPEAVWDTEYDVLRQECWRLVWPTLSHIRRSLLSSSSGQRNNFEAESTRRNDADDDVVVSNYPKHTRSKDIIISSGSGSSVSIPSDDNSKNTSTVDRRNSTGTGTELFLDDTHGLLFLSPRVLAEMEPDIHSQMWTLQPSSFSGSRSPHHKTYARVMHRHRHHSERRHQHQHQHHHQHQHGISTDSLTNITNVYRRYGSMVTSHDCNGFDRESCDAQCTCIDLAWLLLTSACLSKGAQGEVKPPEGYIEYKNFELGVLFHSKGNDVQYRALDSSCPGQEGRDVQVTVAAVTVLPVPYELLGGKAYCDNGRFVTKPYLHDLHELGKVNAQLQLPHESPIKKFPIYKEEQECKEEKKDSLDPSQDVNTQDLMCSAAVGEKRTMAATLSELFSSPENSPSSPSSSSPPLDLFDTQRTNLHDHICF